MTKIRDWMDKPVAALNSDALQAALMRQTELTKPEGALGRLESIAIRLAGLQGTPEPSAEKVYIAVFAADHGVASEGVSAFPQAVTAEMLRNISCGGAAISVLAHQLGADLEVVNLGTIGEARAVDGVRLVPVGRGTENFTRKPAMTEEQLTRALDEGRRSVERAVRADVELYIGGELGIGNSTSAAALACALLNERPERVAGPGTGLDRAGLQHKCEVIGKALKLHRDSLSSPFEVLRCLGGFEIVALVGAYLTCAKKGIPVVVDGFIATTAALIAERFCDGAAQWFLYAHTSAEPGHARVLGALDAEPLLELGMRLGEGSGAAVAVPLLRMACALHKKMATFAQAEVSERH